MKCAKAAHLPTSFTVLRTASFSGFARMREGLKAPYPCGVGEQHGMAVAWRGLGDTKVRMDATPATVVQDCCSTGLAQES